jgi:hypothetical protein
MIFFNAGQHTFWGMVCSFLFKPLKKWSLPMSARPFEQKNPNFEKSQPEQALPSEEEIKQKIEQLT